MISLLICIRFQFHGYIQTGKWSALVIYTDLTRTGAFKLRAQTDIFYF